MKKLLFFVFISLCFVSKGYAQDWINFNSPEGKFSILIPAEPTMQTDSSKTYPNYTSTIFISNSNTDVFAFGWVDYESSFTFDEQGELEANRDNFVKGIKGKLIESNNTTFQGYKCIDFTAETDSYFWSSKVFIVGRRPYQLIAGSSTGKASENEDKFYNSFAIK